MKTLLKELEGAKAILEEAKKNVLWLLDNPTGLVDMKGIGYWAGRVESLRKLTSNSL